MKIEKHFLGNKYLHVLSQLFVSFFAILFFATTMPTVATHAQSLPSSIVLSKLSEEECIDFIIENDIEIPNFFIGNPQLGGFVRSIIQSVGSNPDIGLTFSYDKTFDFVESIKTIVYDYYGMAQGDRLGQSTSALSAVTLQYNELAGPWESDFPYYNCYAYAIGETTLPPNHGPSHYQHQPGDFAGTGSFGSTTTILQLANVVRDDLIEIGWNNVRVESNEPDVLASDENLISIRRSSWDYHFMKYNPSDGYWYHKPGGTAILKYLHHPEDMFWAHEGVYSDGTVWATGNVYDSDVYYIIFSNSPFTTNPAGNTITGIKRGVSLSGELVIPATINGVTITSIGNSAIINQTEITRLSFENRSLLQTIGDSAFLNCTSLANISLPNGITQIGSSAFLNTGIWYSANNNSVVYVGKWAVGVKGQVSNEVTLRADTVGIADGAFSDQTGMKDIQIPSSVKYIGASAFSGCNGLLGIFLPNSITNIGASAFSYCQNLTSIAIPDSVVYLGDSAFGGCAKLMNVDLPNSITNIKANTFSDCYKLESVTLPENLEYLGNAVFYNCKNLTTLYFKGEASPSLGVNMFANCPKLISIYVPEQSLTNYQSGQGWSNYGHLLKTFSTATPTYGLAFNLKSDNTYIVSKGIGLYGGIVIPSTYNGMAVTEIGDFSGSSITSVVIPSSIQIIQNYAFASCSYLTNIVLPDSVRSIGYGAFQRSGLRSINIPYSVETIGNWAFQNCIDLTDVSIYGNITSIGDGMFEGSGLTNIYIPIGTTTIGNNAFNSCKDLERAVISPSVTYIGAGAFENCSKLIEVSIIRGITIGERAFKGCVDLTSITLPDTITTMGRDVFEGCASLSAVKLSAGLTELRTNSFLGCASLVSVDISYGIESIGNSAFEGCTLLTALEIPSSVTLIDWRAFANSGLKKLTIPESVNRVGQEAFDGCRSLAITWVYNPSIQANTFAQYLTEAIIPSGITAIENMAFKNCINLTDITIPSGVTRIGDWSFEHCESLSDIIIPKTVTSVGLGAFTYCYNLKSLIIPINVSYIGHKAFEGSVNITLYAESVSKSPNWHNAFNDAARPIIWGCTLSADKAYVISFAKTENSIANSEGYMVSAPYREGYTFGGWAISAANAAAGISSYSANNIAAAANGTMLYAIWN